MTSGDITYFFPAKPLFFHVGNFANIRMVNVYLTNQNKKTQ